MIGIINRNYSSRRVIYNYRSIIPVRFFLLMNESREISASTISRQPDIGTLIVKVPDGSMSQIISEKKSSMENHLITNHNTASRAITCRLDRSRANKSAVKAQESLRSIVIHCETKINTKAVRLVICAEVI